MSSEGIHSLPSIDSAGYSAEVRIELLVDGRRIPVAQTGGGHIIFDEPVTLPTSVGQVVMHVDGRQRCWRVTLRPEAQPSRMVQAQFETD